MTVFACVCFLITCSAFAADEEASEKEKDSYPWHLGFSVGMSHFEGDEELKGGPYGALRLGYDLSERWTLEGIMYGAPRLPGNEDEFPQQEDSHMAGLAVDAVFHLRQRKRFDPFVAIGAGYSLYTEESDDIDRSDLNIRGGFGLMYRMNSNWSLRLDYRGMLADYGGSVNANSLLGLGIIWTWANGYDSGPDGAAPAKDSDNDGLSDEEEAKLGTDYLNPDTDGDGRNDGEEVKAGTDPLKADA